MIGQELSFDLFCSTTIPQLSGSATDNCAGTLISQSPAIGAVVSLVHNGTINVTVTATDAAGLTDIKTVKLTAKDVIKPVLTAALDQDISLDSGCSITIPDLS